MQEKAAAIGSDDFHYRFDAGRLLAVKIAKHSGLTIGMMNDITDLSKTKLLSSGFVHQLRQILHTSIGYILLTGLVLVIISFVVPYLTENKRFEGESV